MHVSFNYPNFVTVIHVTLNTDDEGRHYVVFLVSTYFFCPTGSSYVQIFFSTLCSQTFMGCIEKFETLSSISSRGYTESPDIHHKFTRCNSWRHKAMYSAAHTGAETRRKPPVAPHQVVISYTLYTSTFWRRVGAGSWIAWPLDGLWKKHPSTVLFTARSPNKKVWRLENSLRPLVSSSF